MLQIVRLTARLTAGKGVVAKARSAEFNSPILSTSYRKGKKTHFDLTVEKNKFHLYFYEGLTTLHLGVRRFKSENGEKSGFSEIFRIFARFLDFLDFDWTFLFKNSDFFLFSWILDFFSSELFGFFRIFFYFWLRFFWVYENFFEWTTPRIFMFLF